MKSENYKTLSQVAKLCPGRPHTSAVWRWCRKGLKSRCGETIRLQHIRVGGKIYTTAEWLSDFFTSIAESDAKHFDSQQTYSRNRRARKPKNSQRESQIHQAHESLKKEGF